MKDSIFWRIIGVGTVFGLLWIGYELGKSSQISPPSFSSAAYADDVKPEKPDAVPKKLDAMPPELVKSKLVFNDLGYCKPTPYGNIMSFARAKVTGGWIILAARLNGADTITFYPDPKHEWNGGSTP